MLILSLVCLKAEAQSESEKRPILITNTPLTFLLGANLGVETLLSPKVSIGGELTGHVWIVPANIAITPTIKYYFKGVAGKGFYVSGKLVAGYFFNKTVVEDAPYYAGGGIGIGGITPLRDRDRFYLFGGLGLKLVSPFGRRPGSNTHDTGAGMAYYAFLSPASLLDVSIGIAIRL